MISKKIKSLIIIKLAIDRYRLIGGSSGWQT